MAASKRWSPDSEQSNSNGGGGGRESPSGSSTFGKRQHLVTFEPVRIPSVSACDDIELHTLRFQNRKLSEKLQYRQRLETSLRARVEQLEKRQTQDDAMLCILNRHWNRLDDDVRILLQRFDAETAVETESRNEDPTTSSFLTQLSQWDHEEMNERLSQRVAFSQRAVAKLVQTFDRILQRNEKIFECLQDSNRDASPSKDIKTEPDESMENSDHGPPPEKSIKLEVDDRTGLEEKLVAFQSEVQTENKKLQLLVTNLQQKNRNLALQDSIIRDRLNEEETRAEELQNKLDDALFEHEKTMQREDKLECRLVEVYKQLQKLELEQIGEAQTDDLAKVSKNKLEEMQANLEEQRELAASRLSELQDLKDQHANALRSLERLRMDLNHLPAETIKESVEYKNLQSQFTVLYEEAARIRECLGETRNQLQLAKTEHLKQIEQLEAEELLAQKQLRHEMIQLEEQLSQVRKEYEMLRLEFEQTLAANEQTGPVNREMKQLLASYKTQNQQLKSEVARYKKKWKEAISTIAKVQKELDQERKVKENNILIPMSAEEKEREAETAESPTLELDEEEGEIADHSTYNDTHHLQNLLEKAKERIRQLKAELATFPKLEQEQREKLQILASEKRLKWEARKIRHEIERISSTERREKFKYYSEEAMKRIKYLEEQMEKLKKEASSSKNEEDTLLNEMEVTGQAFEEMQEQNTRLLQQLKEKDDANFKLMSERIRSNQQHKKLKEEKELVEEQVGALQNQVEAQNLVVRKLEEKERILQQNQSILEKEMALRIQAVDLNKRKAMEFAQSSADLKLQLEKSMSQLTETQQAVATKTASLEDESFKIRRLQEEISSLRKRVERAKKLEKVENSDEVLLEEIRELKEQLTCPSCKVRKKDAILGKCNHVFCMTCLQARYETRRRKCPKCNAAFGANDYRRIYIS